MASNPVFDRIDRESRKGYAGFGRAPQQSATSALGATDTMSQRQLEDLYQQPSAGPVQTGRVTMDDVVMKTAALFGIMLVVAAVAWQLTPQLGTVLLLGGIAATLVLGIVIAVKKQISVPLILTYAAFEGVLVGAASRVYAEAFPSESGLVFDSIVVQAVTGTLCVFVAMLVAYTTGIIKVTDKFRRIITMAVLGYALFALVNLAYAWIGNHPFGFGGSTGWGMLISLFAIGLAAMMLAVDFDSIDRAIAAGAPQKYSWLLAHGLLVTLVWLYLEILRLLGRMRSN